MAHSPKRRKLGHTIINRQDGAGPEDNVHHLTAPKIVQMVKARNSDVEPVLAADMSRSSVLKLQLDEMLLTVQPNYHKIMEPVDRVLARLKVLIESIEGRDPVAVTEATKTMQKAHQITIPFPRPAPAKDLALKVAYSPPIEINVVGSYALKTMVKSDSTLAVDIVVVLPPSILQDKDYLNYRYFYKRAYYLACIAAGLQAGDDDEFEYHFEYLGGNSLQPILVVKPVGIGAFSSTKCLIHVIPAAPPGVFNETKLGPSRNAVRPKDLSSAEKPPLAPTPFYNATIQADSNITRYLDLLHRSSKNVRGFRDACILGRIWLRQRGFSGTISAGGFGNFEWAALCALLLQGGGPKGQSVLSPAYSSYQLFKAVISYLSDTNFIADPASSQTSEVSIPNANFPNFYDGLRRHNILFKMTQWSYVRLLEEAKISIAMLNEQTIDQFENTFILRKDQPNLEYDAVLQLPNMIYLDESSSLDHANQGAKLCSKTYAVLKEGLNDRVKIIHLEIPEPSPWSLKTTPSVTISNILVGVLFDPTNVGRLVDHGPAAEDKKAAAQFRRFWGEKAELRRFRDGSILESVVWSSTSDVSTFEEIVTHLLNRHLGNEITKDVKFISHGFSQLLPGPISSVKASESLQAAFGVLERDIGGMGSLPLQPKILSAISPQLRFSSVIQPEFSPSRHLREPVEVLIQFEGSGRWPDDILAMQQTKLALLIRISNLLKTSAGNITTRLLLENVERPVFNSGALDVIYPSGVMFRLRIYVDREQVLLERLIKEKAPNLYSREDAICAKSLTSYTYIQSLHSQFVATNCVRCPALSPTIRLLKKWFSSHMLWGHFREELIELFVLHTFLQPYPWRAPSSAKTGLLRTLQFLSRWDWRVDPLIVDFSGTMTKKEVESSNARLGAWRKVDPGMKRMALLAVTNDDMTGTAFTDGRPSKVVATRMTALARSACRTLKVQELNLDTKILFRSTPDDYDFILHLSSQPSWNRKEKQHRNTARFKNLEIQVEEDLSLAAYEPISLFVEELQRLYTTSAVFFHNPLNNLAICGLWSPHTQSRVIKVGLPYSTKPISGSVEDHQESEVEIDRSATLSEIARLGGDMIARIEVH